jgi:hypothetical protein
LQHLQILKVSQGEAPLLAVLAQFWSGCTSHTWLFFIKASSPWTVCKACGVTAVLLPSFNKNLRLALCSNWAMHLTAQTHHHSSTSSTQQTRPSMQSFLTHVHKGCRLHIPQQCCHVGTRLNISLHFCVCTLPIVFISEGLGVSCTCCVNVTWNDHSLNRVF